LKYFRICVDENKISPAYKQYFSNNKSFCGTKKVISGNDWSLKEMNVVIYPEVRFYKGIIKKWKEKNPNSEAEFFIYQYPFKAENFIEYK
jgi:5,10-methylenetetrahydrofolate reductase